MLKLIMEGLVLDIYLTQISRKLIHRLFNRDFDHEAAVKRNLTIVSANTVVHLPEGISVLLIIHEGILMTQTTLESYQNFN
jgi:S-adenosylmethionine/arginine decarboxylase-like enzyme